MIIDQPEYSLKFNRTILIQFANTFNNSNAAISELIANSYDAGAKFVSIEINTINKSLTISDDGIGMNTQDIEDKFLDIGYNKRSNIIYSNSKRRIMGRKGSGRLGIFSFSNKMRVKSKKENEEVCNVTLDLKELIRDEKSEPFSEENGLKLLENHGTTIELSQIDADLGFIFKDLARYISVHFSHVIGNEDDPFNISLVTDGKTHRVSKKPEIFDKLDRFIPLTLGLEGLKKWENEISKVKSSHLLLEERDIENGYDPNSEDQKKERVILIDEKYISEYNKNKRKDDKKLEFGSWTIKSKNLKHQMQEIRFEVKGWIGSLSSIEDREGGETNVVNHGLIVYARNRVVVPNLMKDIKTNRFYQSYIVGEIFADRLDDDKLIDIINISRDNFGDQDERYPKLKQYVEKLINLLISEKEKIKEYKKKRKTKIAKKTASNILSKLIELGVDEKTIKEKIAPVFAKETGYKLTSRKPLIFISYLSIKKSPQSFYMSKIIYQILESELRVKEHNVDIVYTGSAEDGIPYGESIMDYLRKQLAVNIERVAFIACIADNYINNWYTAVEYGASWGLQKKQFILINESSTAKKFDPPLSSLLYLDLEPLIIDQWKQNQMFFDSVLKLIKDILTYLKIKDDFSDGQIKNAINKVFNEFKYHLSVTNSDFKQTDVNASSVGSSAFSARDGE